MNIRLIGICVLVLLVLGSVAGCGDDGSDDSAGSASGGEAAAGSEGSGPDGRSSGGQVPPVETGELSKAQFIKQAEKVCREQRLKMGKELEQLGKATNTPAGGATEARAIELALEPIFIPGIEAHAEEIAALGAPGGDVAQVEALVAALREGADAAAATEVRSFDRFSALFKRFDRLARAYGLNGCVFL